jgi:hypothetical protein
MQNQKQIYFYLLGISAFSYILGYILNENSAGGGSYVGDLKLIWANLQIYLNNSINNSLMHDGYIAGRTPIAYILHKYLNPLTSDVESFRFSVFVISLFTPILLVLILKFKNSSEDHNISIFVASLIMLSPFFRTTSYWGLEENYGLIFLIISYFFLNKFIKFKNRELINIKNIFFICFFSSLTFYFDQKLIIIPLICFTYILLISKSNYEKLFSIIIYSLLAIPYLFLIKVWGGLLPPSASNRMLTLETVNIGYTISIIAFYIFPFFVSKKVSINSLISFFKSRSNFILIIFLIIYLIIFFLFYDSSNKWISGNGVFYKVSNIIFSEFLHQKIFLMLIIFFSSLILLFFFETLHDRLIILFFILLSLVVTPVYQEYLDPLILIMIFTFFKKKIYLNFKQSLFVYSYFLIFLISANFYYYKALGKFY